MTRRFAGLILILTLAGCGVDGEPSAPVEPRVNAGLTINSSGIHPSANVGVGKGPVSVNVGLGRWARGWW